MADTTGQLTPSDYLHLVDLLGGVSATPEKTAALEKQQAMAQMMREGPMTHPGVHIPGAEGGVYVAPNAMQSIGSALNQGMALHQQQQMQQALMQNANNQQNARTAYMRAMVQHLMGGQPGMVPGGPPAPGQQVDESAVSPDMVATE